MHGASRLALPRLRVRVLRRSRSSGRFGAPRVAVVEPSAKTFGFGVFGFRVWGFRGLGDKGFGAEGFRG